MSEPNDAEVVARARAGDDESFRLLVERHSRALFHLAWRITSNEQDAEDVVQETFMKAHRNLGSFESRANFGTWLHRIAANAAVDVARARQRKGVQVAPRESEEGDPIDPVESLPSAAPGADRLLLSGEVHKRVSATMSRLSPNERAAFVLRHFEDRPIEEIGRMLGLKDNATKQSIFRAVKKLRRALEPIVAPARS